MPVVEELSSIRTAVKETFACLIELWLIAAMVHGFLISPHQNHIYLIKLKLSP